MKQTKQKTSGAAVLIMDAEAIRGALRRIAHEIIERNPQLTHVVLAGIPSRGVQIAQRVAPLGWHVVIYFEAAELPELFAFIASLPTTVVVDHMGRPDVTRAVEGPEFELFVKLMRDPRAMSASITGMR